MQDLAVKKRQQQLHEEGMQDIVDLLQKLDSEQEVENLSMKSRKKLQQRLASKKI